MANCEDLFQKIQDLNEKRSRVAGAAEELNSINPDDLSPDRKDDVVRKAMGLGPVDKAAEDVAKRRRSNRQRGRFNNARALADRLGDEEATSLLALLRGMDEAWKDLSPEDYAAQVAAYSRKDLAEALQDAADAAGLDVSDELTNSVQANLAPFLPILKNQARLKVYAEVGRAGYMSRIKDIEGLLDAGDYTTQELFKAKQELVKSYLRAVTSQRARNIARTRSGQLLRNERDLMGPQLELGYIETPVNEKADGTSQGMVDVNPKTGKVEVRKRIKDAIEQTQETIEAEVGAKVGATAKELADKGSTLNRVIDAANQGKQGVAELKRIRNQVGATADVIDDLVEVADWQKYARSGYKDSILGGVKSVLQNNYLSQKMVFAAEGYRAIPSNAARIYVGNLRNPVGTSNWRNLMTSLSQGSAAATRANMIAESVIKQSWTDSILKDIFSDDLKFAGNVDRINNRTGQISIAEQYDIAAKVVAEPLSPNPFRLSMQLRDKMAWGSKAFVNHHITNKVAGQQLPVLTVLKINEVIDNRAGLRTFVTDRANELQLEYFGQNPRGTVQGAVDYANAKIKDELYQANPSDAQVNSYRQQFDAGSEISDDQIRETIAMTKVGQPVLDTPSRQGSFEKSREFRMQGNTADNVAGLKQTKDFLQLVRKNEYGDYFVPFLKSWAEQTAWDLGTGGTTAISTALEIGGVMRRGDPITPELAGKAAGAMTMTASVLTLFAGIESMGEDSPVQFIGTGPTYGEPKRQYEQALKAKGQMKNTLYFKDVSRLASPLPIVSQLARSLPIANLPLIRTMMIYKDIKNAWERGRMTDADFGTAMGGVTSVFAGLILRAPGLYQLQWVVRSLGQLEGKQNFGQAVAEISARFAASSLPTNGVTRTVGQVQSGGTGSDYDSLITTQSRKLLQAENDWYEKLPPDHPLKSNLAKLQRLADLGGTPELVRALGGRDRQYTYLGRKWNGLKYLPATDRNSWPDGVPALQIDDDYAVESELDRIGMYNEPPVFRSHKLSGLPVTPKGINDLEIISGTMTSDGYRDDGRIGTTTKTLRTGLSGQGKEGSLPGTKMKGVLNRAVKGNTWREALNVIFTSPEYMALKESEEFGNTGDMSDVNRKASPATELVGLVNKHYNDMLESKFIEKGLQEPEIYEGAAQYVMDRQLLLPTPEQAAVKKRKLNDLTKGVVTAQ